MSDNHESALDLKLEQERIRSGGWFWGEYMGRVMSVEYKV